ncbi:MAG TPA: ADOP family duplicated permease [Gemmatimonadaceae bacterium]|nr:ADOP family duplicated permease [Gemmatimonadaceae bacterium]
MTRPTSPGAPPPAPPRLAVRLLQALLPAADGEALVGDLLEEFHHRADGGGAAAARRWLWRESLVAVLTARRGRGAPSPHTGGSPMRALPADLRHAARALRRAPLFTAFCTLTFGLAIGAAAAIFSVANPLLLQPLPYAKPGQLAMVWERDERGERINVGFATFDDLRHQARTLAGAAAVGGWEPTLSDGEAERLVGQRVTAGFFGLLGVRPALGRDFLPVEDAPERTQVVILSHGLWQRRFGGDSSLVGRTIRLDGAPYLVAGVLPAGFQSILDPAAQIWRVLGYEPSQPWACRTCRHLRMVARVRDGASLEAASAELDRLFALMAAAHPDDYKLSPRLLVSPMRDEVSRRVRPVLLAVLGAVGLVLLIAVVNVANLQLARAIRREGELAIRSALGAGRGRLARQFVAEGLLLAVCGGVAGLALAHALLPALLARVPEELPRQGDIRLDATALAVTAALTLLLGIVVGLVPAWHGGRAALFGVLRDGGRSGGGRRRLRSALVVGEVALALVLLVGAGLLGRSLVRLLSVDVGFDPRQLLTLEVQATGPAYDSAASAYANRERLRAAVAALPGVVAVGTTSQLPLSGSLDEYGVRVEGRPTETLRIASGSDRYVVSADFMRAMGIRILRGRALAATDRDSTPPVVVVSASVARGLWPGEDPIGKRLQMGGEDTPWREVVGVADDVRHSGLDATVTQQIYIPERQWLWADAVVTLVVRTRGDPEALAPAVYRTARAVDPTQPVARLRTMEQVVAASTAQRRLALTLFAAFAAVALLLAALGIYGVLASLVAERRREIGVRTALGATPAATLRLVMAHGARLAGLGLVLGVGGALALGRLLQGLLYAVRPGDPLTLVMVAALLALVAGLACLVPALRALRVSPMTALRVE